MLLLFHIIPIQLQQAPDSSLIESRSGVYCKKLSNFDPEGFDRSQNPYPYRRTDAIGSSFVAIAKGENACLWMFLA